MSRRRPTPALTSTRRFVYPFHMRTCRLLWGATIFATSATAGAAEPLRLVIAAESTCENAQSVAERLRARQLDVGLSGRELRVEANTTSTGAEATFELDTGETIARRTLTAETCDAVLDAVAFAVELALVGQPDPEPPEPAPPLVEPEPAPALKSDPMRGYALSTLAAVGASAVPLGPALRLEGRVELEVQRGSVFSPSFRLGGLFQEPTFTGTVAGASLGFCPIRALLRNDHISLRPCLRTELGRNEVPDFAGRALGTADATRSYFVFATGASFAARFDVAGPLFFDAELAPMLMHFASSADSATYPRVDLSLGLGARFL